MASKTFTIDTNEWKYVDSYGIPHTVTNGQTFTIELTDGGASVVTYNQHVNTKVTTTDGYTIHFRQQTDINNTARKLHTFADTEDGVSVYGKGGELVAECPVSGRLQYWRPAKITLNNVDAPTALTATRLEDQFGNVMNIPNTGGGITIS